MPATSKAQQRLMAAAEHGADFPMAKKLRKSMSHQQLHDFASGSMSGKPEHAGSSPLKGDHAAANVKIFKNQGMNERDATIASMRAAQSGKPAAKGHPNRHKNLGNHLKPRKDGKPHGSPKVVDTDMDMD